MNSSEWHTTRHRFTLGSTRGKSNSTSASALSFYGRVTNADLTPSSPHVGFSAAETLSVFHNAEKRWFNISPSLCTHICPGFQESAVYSSKKKRRRGRKMKQHQNICSWFNKACQSLFALKKPLNLTSVQFAWPQNIHNFIIIIIYSLRIWNQIINSTLK